MKAMRHAMILEIIDTILYIYNIYKLSFVQ